MKAVFVGLGYIGLPTAALVASNGIEVLGVDTNQKVVDTVNAGKIHIIEPHLSELVSEVVRSGMLRAATIPEEADAFFIVVPTPFKQNHRADISYVEGATRTVIPFLKPGDLFVIESTSPVPTGSWPAPRPGWSTAPPTAVRTVVCRWLPAPARSSISGSPGSAPPTGCAASWC